MATDVLTTATATQQFNNGTIVLYVSPFGTLQKISGRTYLVFPSGSITSWASGLTNKFDDYNYYTA